jgi:hypothetical protein
MYCLSDRRLRLRTITIEEQCEAASGDLSAGIVASILSVLAAVSLFAYQDIGYGE